MSLSKLDAPCVSVIVVNYNAGLWLQRCIESLRVQTRADFECFIVDNGSSDGSVQALDLGGDARFTLIEAGENLGFAAANNLAAKRAQADWLALLNPDAFARSDWIEKLLIATTIAPNVTMVGSTQIMANDPNIYDGVGDFYHASGLAWRAKFGHVVGEPLPYFEAFGPCAAGGLYRRDMFEQVGGFDERFFCYHEDVDLAFRFRLAGGICVQSPEAIIDHVSSGISGRASDFAVYHGTRNRMWTFFKNMPLLALIILTPLHVLMTLFILAWASIRSGRFKPTLRGLLDGLKGLPTIFKSRKYVIEHASLTGLDVLRLVTWQKKPVSNRDVPVLVPLNTPT